MSNKPRKTRRGVITRKSVGSKRRIKPCPVGTLVSYKSVDGTCRMIENTRHAWLEDGTCANCDMTRAEAGYAPIKIQNKINERGGIT